MAHLPNNITSKPQHSKMRESAEHKDEAKPKDIPLEGHQGLCQLKSYLCVDIESDIMVTSPHLRAPIWSVK